MEKKNFKKSIFFLISTIIIPLFFLLCVNFSLYVFSYGHPTDFYIKKNGLKGYGNNEKFTWTYFPPSLARTSLPFFIKSDKPEKTYRIFVLGASAAMGIPEPSFSFSRMLDYMLQKKFPDVKFEIINTAITAINSHVVYKIAKESARFDGDLMIVYLGNNEVVGPFGAGTVFNKMLPDISFIRSSVEFKSTRLGQLFANSFSYFGKKDTSLKKWRGMEMFANNKISLEDKRMSKVYENFYKNLTDIIDVAKNANMKIILSTVAVNLKDNPPFSSMHKESFLPEEESSWKEKYHAGIEYENSGLFDKAILEYLGALRIDDKFADLHYRLGRAYFKKGNLESAYKYYILARDLDALRFRADSKINNIIRNISKEKELKNVSLVDAENIFLEKELEKNSLPGKELFYEHVHMNPNGNYLLAKSIMKTVSSILIERNPEIIKEDGKIVSQSEVLKALALTPWDQNEIYKKILSMFKGPPFTNQIDNNKQKKQIMDLLNNLKNNSVRNIEESYEMYQAAIIEHPKDWLLHENFGLFLFEGLKEYEKSLKEWFAVLKLMPDNEYIYSYVGDVKFFQKNFEDAILNYKKVIQTNSVNNASLYNRVGMAYANNGNFTNAEKNYKLAIKADSGFGKTYFNLANLYGNNKKYIQAIVQYKIAIQFDSNNAEIYNNFANISAKNNDLDNSVKFYRKAIEIDPNFKLAKRNLKYILLLRDSKKE